MRISSKARMNRMFTHGGCLDVAIDHGVCNEPSFMVGLEDMAAVVDTLIGAGPDAIQMAYGQADLLQTRPEKDKPALVMRIDMGNPYNDQRHREMWSMLQNHDDPIAGALEMDAACVVVNLFMLPDEPELFRQCVGNISKVRAACHTYGMPLMIEPLVMLPNEVRGGYRVDSDADRSATLVRVASEMGADIIKADPTEHPEDFHRVVEAARVPVLVRGGGNQVLSVEPLVHPDMFMAVGFGPGRYMNIEASATTAANLEWYVREVVEPGHRGGDPFERVNARVAEVEPKRNDPFFHPFLFGSGQGAESRAGFYGLAGWHGDPICTIGHYRGFGDTITACNIRKRTTES